MAELKSRTKFERDLSGRLASLGARHRKELQLLLGSPPDLARVPETFWERVEEENREALAVILLLIFSASGELHGWSEDVMNRSATSYSASRAAQVSREYAAAARRSVERRATEWTGDTTTSTVRDDLVTVFSPRVAESIAVTETTGAVTAGGDGAAVAKRGSISKEDIWWTENDGKVCPTCHPLHGSKRGTDWTIGPPAHFGCRCWIEYAIPIEEPSEK